MRRFARVLLMREDRQFLSVAQEFNGRLLWNFPGGKVEAHESPRDAARRELLEEVGINVRPSSLKFLLKRKVEIDGVRWDGYFYAHVGSNVFPEIREPKISSARYLSVYEMSDKPAHHALFSDVAASQLPSIVTLAQTSEHLELWIQSVRS